jgi:hypothetical protein
MQSLGFTLGLSTLVPEALLLWRARQGQLLSCFPFFYSYLVYVLCGSATLFVVYRVRPNSYPSAYWFYFVLSIVVEFAVLIEISDHIFQPFLAIRNLGRAITIVVSVALGLVYILPTILESRGMRMALLDFALRASLTKAFILAILLFAAHHYGLKLGRNVAGLMLGFSIYLGVNVANFASVECFGNLYANILWIMSPIAFTLCLLVWTGALWKLAPMPGTRPLPSAAGGDSEALVLELARFNNTLPRFLNK